MPTVTLRLLILPAIVFLGGCVTGSPLRMEVVNSQGLVKPVEEVTLITKTAYDADIRRELARQGFRVKRFSSTENVTRIASSTSIEQFSAASSRYGLSVLPGQRIDYCIGRSADLLGRVVFELSDLQTNDVLLYVEGGGWTDTCGISATESDLLWPKLVKKLREATKD